MDIKVSDIKVDVLFIKTFTKQEDIVVSLIIQESGVDTSLRAWKNQYFVVNWVGN